MVGCGGLGGWQMEKNAAPWTATTGRTAHLLWRKRILLEARVQLVEPAQAAALAVAAAAQGLRGEWQVGSG